ncbi:HDOD domain-containing protein [Nitrincola alkalilacustris]|uniref:HDOD domain-containing protein n=1 Tax=Nitrincola alkalilacustris TaxID=1571224 RepID=UPI00124E7757|nr:HDOD domain-containing protein [Nitrincola alkalilacustris]
MSASSTGIFTILCDLGSSDESSDLILPAGDKVRVTNIDSAWAEIERNDCRVLIVRSDKAFDKAIGFLKEVRRRYPGLARILIAGELSTAQAGIASEVVHSILQPDSGLDELQQAIKRALKAEELITDKKLRSFISSVGHLPSFPEVLGELNEVLESEVAGAREVANILQKDPAMVAKIMQLVSSAYFSGGYNTPTTLKEAVNLLGLRAVRDLVLSIHVFKALPQDDSWRSFSFQQLQNRSIVVSQFAAEICKNAGYDRHVQGQARTAGLLHDVGMMLLALNNRESYHAAMVRAQELGQPIYVVEKMMMGVTHPQAGAYLLDLWSLAPETIHAILFHHVPMASGDTGFTPLTAVHVADSMLPPLFNAMGCNLGGRLSRDYLARIGMLEKHPEWDKMAHEYASQIPSHA